MSRGEIKQLPVEPLAHSVEGAAQRIGISRRSVYVNIASGELHSIKIGKRRLITDMECQRFIARHVAAAA